MNAKPVFRPSFGNRPDQLVGRNDVLDLITAGLSSYPGSAGRATFLMGQRGMGKTAILLEVADRARSLGYVTARVTCGDTMLDNLIEMLQQAGSEFVTTPKKPVKGFSAGAFGFSFGLTFTDDAQRSLGFRMKLGLVCERLAEAGKRVLVLVDEVDPSVEQMRSLATAYQELVGEEADIALVMAGLPSAVSDTLNYRTLTFLNRAQRISLGPISITEVEVYYHSAFARAGVKTDADIEAKAALATEGFPYLIQLIGYYLVEFCMPGVPASGESLERATAAALRELNDKVFRAMLNPLSDGDIAFLHAMAEEGTPTLKAASLEGKLGLAHGTVQTYRKRLLDAGVITAPRRGEVAFALPALAGYLRAMLDEDPAAGSNNDAGRSAVTQ